VKYIGLIAVLCLGLPLAACGGDSPSGEEKSESAPAKVFKVPPKPKIQAPDAPPPKELIVKDLRVGTGREAKIGNKVTVQYVGAAYKTGKEFDARLANAPFFFLLGKGQVMPGLDQGLKGMKVGGRRELIIPPGLTYDELGTNETLIYVIDLL
jgi:peptidylprolyl isomerase